ncbi:CubicO group peptidase, beta-lactamase class C family [Paracoccus halophilus]|uniref:6-aminohexanoate hydrolase n=1 Tax=Paracoccus halophilus TaxID=376733 RepID=A0A099F5D0_9RHOB|nr:serine hydrolase [Paracoccus halophilus]KGJ05421.1 6-aminohexanoate hydrolase [Paracoccus halophilus]SFA49137.1 CubicO group peptidase, beta-lactamase class C family [Paracoccus halophilus]
MARISRRDLTSALGAALAMPLLARRGAAQDALRAIAAEARQLTQLRALVLHQRGRRLFAEAFRDPPLTRPANIKSVSKSIVALLTGIAIDRGVIRGTAQPVLPLLGRAPFGDARDRLTVADLLSMRAGLASTSGEDYGAWVSSSDWVEFALTRPLEDTPGGRFIYSTGGWHILGAALARAAGRDLHQLAREWLGDPLGIAIPPWIRDPQGRFMGGNDMAISPPGLARIGDMLLNGGEIDGRRVVSRAWLETSWRPRARSPFSGDRYGYGWFLTRYGGQSGIYARGYGGQLLAILPGSGLCIAITSDPGLPARGDGHFGDLRRLVERIAAEF